MEQESLIPEPKSVSISNPADISVICFYFLAVIGVGLWVRAWARGLLALQHLLKGLRGTSVHCPRKQDHCLSLGRQLGEKAVEF